MNISDKRDLAEFDKEVQKYLEYFSLPGMQINLKGSSQYKFLIYRSDYDVLIQVRKDTPVAQIFNNLKKSLEKIEKDPNVFFIELKLETQDGAKTRFHHGDVFSYSDFEQVFGNMKMFKVDIVMNIQNKFYEASCVYRVSSDELLTNGQVVETIKEDIEEYLAKGMYYKVLKRWFSIYVLYNNVASVEHLVQVFNSDLGKLYEIICNMQAIEILYQYYKDDRTVEKIQQNLKLIQEGNFSIKALHRKLNIYLRDLNKHAKKIYKGMKEEIRYP
jgi:hypothetical protein